MRSTFIILMLSTIGFSILYSCSEPRQDVEKPKQAEMAKTSELAQMMRDIHAHAAEMRAAILADSTGALPQFHSDFWLMNSLTPTDSSVRTPVFEGLTGVFVESVENVANSSEGRIFKYNNMLNACVGCHKTYCPGPIKKINKLRI